MLKNIAKVILSNFILAIIGLVNSFIFPVLLSMESYAYYQEYLLYLSYINICHLGIASGMFLNYAGKRYKEIDKKQYKSEVYLIYIVLAFFSIVGVIVAGIIKNELLIYVAFSILPNGLIASFQALYQSWERFTGYAIINALPKLLFVVGVIVSCIMLHTLTGIIVVALYVAIIWGIALYFIIEFIFFTRGEKANRVFSDINIKTTGEGFLITLGNYVNLLFHLIDKQFVSILYSTTAFAIYSFAMSLQNIMMLFITALSNPLYTRLAKGEIDKKYIEKLKEILFIFGAYSGCAYFAVSFIVKHFIIKYEDSLSVVSVFFAVFPAMAVINVLYINMYKIKRNLKKYILTLVGMLLVAIILNGISVIFQGDYIGIAFATMVSYYVWLLYSQRDFEEINIVKKDYIYLLGFFVLYFILSLIKNDVVGFMVYTITISAWNYWMYKDTIRYVIELFRKKRRN